MIFNLNFHISGNSYHIGIDFTKGIFLHLLNSGLYISKNGIHHYLKKASCSCPSLLYLLFARLISLLEIPLFILTLPFSILIYTFVFVLASPLLLLSCLTCPFKFNTCFSNSTGILTNRQITKLISLFVLGSLLSLLKVLLLTISIPFQILAPELLFMVCRLHKSGIDFDYLD